MTDNCGKCIRCLDEGWKPGDPADSGLATLVKPSRRRMVVCQHCGNKRCPCATYHRHPCTNSNWVGQPGSIYGPDVADAVSEAKERGNE